MFFLQLKNYYPILLSGLTLLSPLAFSNEAGMVGGSYSKQKHDIFHIDTPMVINKNEVTGDWEFNTHFNQNLSKDLVNSRFDVLDCQKNHCVAAGMQFTEDKSGKRDTKHFMQQSSDGGLNWSIIDNIKDLPDDFVPEGSYINYGCDQSLCFFTGASRHYDSKGTLTNQPFVIRSEDAGKSWAFIDLSPFVDKPLNVSSTSVACHESYCVLVGSIGVVDKSKMKSVLILLTSKDYGKTWSDKVSIEFPEDYQSISQHSISYNNNRFHIAGGYLSTSKHIAPLLLNSDDFGASWQSVSEQVTDANADTMELRHSVQCQDNDCVSYAYLSSQQQSQPPLVVLVSHDNGSTWFKGEVHVPESLLDAILLNSIEHTGSNWLLAGFQVGYLVKQAPVILTSSDNGNNWWPVLLNTQNFPNGGEIHSLSCAGIRCTAAGLTYNDSMRQQMLILESADAGQTWLEAPVSNMPSEKLGAYLDFAVHGGEEG